VAYQAVFKMMSNKKKKKKAEKNEKKNFQNEKYILKKQKTDFTIS
jgi:hypothetical protein